MERNIFQTLAEAIAEAEDHDGIVDAVILPPSNNGYATDVKEGDDDIGLAGNLNLPNDVAGEMELMYHNSDDDSESDSDDETVTDSNWRNGSRLLVPMEAGEVEPFCESHPELVDKSPMELYKMYFDTAIEQLFVDNTINYAHTVMNELRFKFTTEDLWDFVTIITLSSYNIRTMYIDYWSIDDDLSNPLVRYLMSRDRFKEIKRNLHVADNTQLDDSDKWSKLRPLVDMVNAKLSQFGVFNQHLSIDEQMVPYFGRHSCKMFIRGKPIRFGFKNWVLAGDDGYPFKVSPYQGKEYTAEGKELLGPKVVKDLISIVENPKQHELYFDNFFTSVPLLTDLRENDIKATVTIRSNRLKETTLIDDKSMKKKERGAMTISATREICTVRWVDNKVVTVLSNHQTEQPLVRCKRYIRKKKHEMIPQPQMITKYNKHMGGVNQLDSFLNNLRPCIGG